MDNLITNEHIFLFLTKVFFVLFLFLSLLFNIFKIFYNNDSKKYDKNFEIKAIMYLLILIFFKDIFNGFVIIVFGHNIAENMNKITIKEVVNILEISTFISNNIIYLIIIPVLIISLLYSYFKINSYILNKIKIVDPIKEESNKKEKIRKLLISNF